MKKVTRTSIIAKVKVLGINTDTETAETIEVVVPAEKKQKQFSMNIKNAVPENFAIAKIVGDILYKRVKREMSEQTWIENSVEVELSDNEWATSLNLKDTEETDD